jgi:hypothetical protein
MTSTSASMVGLCLAYAGFAALALAMDRHYADAFGRGESPSPLLRRGMQWAGSLGLVLSLATIIAQVGWAIGSVIWLGVLTLAALPLALLLAYAPRIGFWAAAPLAAAALVASVAGWV